MDAKEQPKIAGFVRISLLILVATVTYEAREAFGGEVAVKAPSKNAYATMMYMGTPRDYEFYVAIRVLLRSLAALDVQADRVVIASLNVPLRWVHAL